MSETTFINTAKTAISAKLQEALNDGAKVIAAQLLQDEVAFEDYSKLVAVFLLHPEAPADHLIVKKENLRGFVKDLQRRARRRLPIYESTISRCLENLPSGAMRVLYISDESCGTLRLSFDENPLKDVLQSAIYNAEAALDASDSTRKLAEEVKSKIAHLPRDQALRALENAQLTLDDNLREIWESKEELQEAREKLVDNFINRIPGFREGWKSVLERVKKVVVPPDGKSPNNIEAILMAGTYAFEKVTVGTGLSTEEVSFLIGNFANKEPTVRKILERMNEVLRGAPFSGDLQDFGIEWMRSGFPKLEVGQKLAASLALTDVPDDIEVIAPWKAWSLVVPPGLFGESEKEGHVARIWCAGTSMRFVVLSKGGLLGSFNEEKAAAIFADKSEGHRLWSAMDSLVRGACLALSNPDDYKRQKVKDTANKAHKKQRDGEPDFEVSRFMLSAPVQIDMRQALLDTLVGRKSSLGGGSPTVQFFVRGHWRNQAHGPGRALRKQIRIEGFWKGPEEGRVLLRNYKVKDEEEAKP